MEYGAAGRVGHHRIGLREPEPADLGGLPAFEAALDLSWLVGWSPPECC